MINLISSIISTCLIVYFISCFIIGYNNKHHSLNISDHFDIGYIRKEQPNNEVVIYQKPDDEEEIKNLKEELSKLKLQLNKFSEKAEKPKEAPLPKKEINQNNKLFDECVLALIALGYKQRAAKEEVKKFLSQNVIKSAEEFIIQFFKKGK